MFYAKRVQQLSKRPQQKIKKSPSRLASELPSSVRKASRSKVANVKQPFIAFKKLQIIAEWIRYLIYSMEWLL